MIHKLLTMGNSSYGSILAVVFLSAISLTEPQRDGWYPPAASAYIQVFGSILIVACVVMGAARARRELEAPAGSGASGSEAY